MAENKINLYLDYGVTENCINHNSYGEICVGCNCCGRFDKSTMKQAQLIYYKECLEEEKNFNNWSEDDECREIQEKNVKLNIESLKIRIAELEGEI